MKTQSDPETHGILRDFKGLSGNIRSLCRFFNRFYSGFYICVYIKLQLTAIVHNEPAMSFKQLLLWINIDKDDITLPGLMTFKPMQYLNNYYSRPRFASMTSHYLDLQAQITLSQAMLHVRNISQYLFTTLRIYLYPPAHTQKSTNIPLIFLFSRWF